MDICSSFVWTTSMQSQANSILVFFLERMNKSLQGVHQNDKRRDLISIPNPDSIAWKIEVDSLKIKTNYRSRVVSFKIFHQCWPLPKLSRQSPKYFCKLVALVVLKFQMNNINWISVNTQFKSVKHPLRFAKRRPNFSLYSSIVDCIYKTLNNNKNRKQLDEILSSSDCD